MQWMWDAMWARIGWALGELLIGISLLLAMLLGALIYSVVVERRQARCLHERTWWTGPGQSEHRCLACRKMLNT